MTIPLTSGSAAKASRAILKEEAATSPLNFALPEASKLKTFSPEEPLARILPKPEEEAIGLERSKVMSPSPAGLIKLT